MTKWNVFRKVLIASALLAGLNAHAGDCTGADDEADLKVRMDAGPALFLCGFEDHEIKAPKGNRTFGDFNIYWWTPRMKDRAQLYTSEIGNMFWIKADPKATEMTELWFFSDKPEPALVREITCDAETCKVSGPKCILKLRKNPYPKALAAFHKSPQDLGDSGEDIIDQIFAQALAGDPAANKFFAAAPKVMDVRLTDVYESDQRKLVQAKELGCAAK